MGESSNRNRKRRDIAPGIWEDMDGMPHVDIPAMMQQFDIEDTPKNRQEITDVVEGIIRQQFPKAQVKQRLIPD